MLALKVTKIGNSVGVILPQEARHRLKVGTGDVLYATEAPDGSYRLTAHDTEFARQMAVAECLMHRDRDIAAALAKL